MKSLNIAILSILFMSLYGHADLVLRLDAGGLSPGTLASWADTSINNFDANQAIAANQPSVVNGGANFNNLNVVELAGNTGANNDFLSNNSVNYAAQTVLAVFRVDTSLRETTKLGQIWGQYAGPASIHVAPDFRNTGFTSFDGNADPSPQARYAMDGAAYSGMTDGSSGQPWVNNTTHLINTEFDSAVTITEHHIGALIPTFDIATHAFGGQIGEILVFDDPLSNDERSGLEHLIAERWGLSGPAAANAGQITAANALFPGGFYTIPEPSSLALLLLGTFALMTRLRRLA